MSNRGVFPESEARQIVRCLLGAVHFLHSKLVVHRDVKPENILYRSERRLDDFVLADLGFAHRLENEKDKIIGVVGTPGYAAPEVRSGSPHLQRESESLLTGFNKDLFQDARVRTTG
jgi:calcium/calmodulin-dependent protein kinase I